MLDSFQAKASAKSGSSFRRGAKHRENGGTARHIAFSPLLPQHVSRLQGDGKQDDNDDVDCDDGHDDDHDDHDDDDHDDDALPPLLPKNVTRLLDLDEDCVNH